MPKKRSLVYQREGSGNWYITGLRISTGTDDFDKADALARKIKQDRWMEARMGIKPPRSWQEAVVKWLKEKAWKVSIQDDIERLAWLDQHLGSVPDIGKISRDQIDAIMQTREGVSVDRATSQNATANQYVALVVGILNAAEREWQWGNRAPRLRRYKTLTDKGQALTPEDWKKLEAVLVKHLCLIATFSVSTGLRAGKVFGLQWSQINLAQGTMTFTGTENKLGNTIPLNATALAVLKAARALPVVHKTHVFNYAGKPVKGYGKEAWRGALQRAGVARIRFHDLRHTFNSWLAQRGVEKDVRMRLVGHRVGDSHDRYTHLNVEHLRPYSQIIDTILAQAGGHSGDKQLAKMG